MGGSGGGTPVTIAGLSEHAFIDIDYFNQMADDNLVVESSSGQSTDELRLVALINSVTVFMEKFCNRPLKARDFSYISTDSSYNPQYAIFDPPSGENFWFPTYPVNSITTFLVSGTAIVPTAEYDLSDDGYVLYASMGKLYYPYGFDLGYRQNVKIKWNGGIQEGTDEYEQLKYIQYLFVRQLFDSDPINDDIVSETLVNYSYKKASSKELAEYFGIPLFVFNRLEQYRRFYFP